jgi:uncharacterized protein YjiK
MKIKSIILLLGVLILCCNRNGPDSVSTPDIQSLNPINTYNIAIPEPSGLVYNSKDSVLMVVSDANSTVSKLDFTGRVLHSMIIQSSDLEGIALSANCDTMYVAEETNQLITKYLPDGTKLSSFPVNVATNIKHGPEGVTINKNGKIVVINEKLPCLILEFDGTGNELGRKELNYSTDLSDIFYCLADSCYWIVSDESKMLMKLSDVWVLIKAWNIPVNKAEGVVIVNEKIYIVSDSDAKMYVFQKPN